MSEIKVNDRVRLVKRLGRDAGLEGTVTQVLEGWSSNGPMYVVQFDDFNDTYSAEELEVFDPAPVEAVVGGVIPFDQIRKGDRIQTVREFADGFIIRLEGVAERLVPEANGQKSWRMGQSHTVAPSGKGIAVQQHHILLERKEAAGAVKVDLEA